MSTSRAPIVGSHSSGRARSRRCGRSFICSSIHTDASRSRRKPPISRVSSRSATTSGSRSVTVVVARAPSSAPAIVTATATNPSTITSIAAAACRVSRVRVSSHAIGRLRAIATKPPISSHTIAGVARCRKAQISTPVDSIAIASRAPRQPVGTVIPPIERACRGSSCQSGGRLGGDGFVSAAQITTPSTSAISEPPIPAMAMPRPTLITYGATPTRSVAGSINRRRTYIAARPRRAAVASAVHARGRGSRASSTTNGSNPIDCSDRRHHEPHAGPDPHRRPHPAGHTAEQTVATAADTTPAQQQRASDVADAAAARDRAGTRGRRPGHLAARVRRRRAAIERRPSRRSCARSTGRRRRGSPPPTVRRADARPPCRPRCRRPRSTARVTTILRWRRRAATTRPRDRRRSPVEPDRVAPARDPRRKRPGCGGRAARRNRA